MLLETLTTICTSHKETEQERGRKKNRSKIESALQKGEWNSVIANFKDVLHW